MKKYLLFSLFLFVSTAALSQEQQNTPIKLTFEQDRASFEDTIFNALSAVRYEDPKRAVSGYYSGMLSTLTVREVQSLPLPVKKGDIFSLHTYAQYQRGRNKKLLKKLALAIATSVAAKQISRTVDYSEGQNKRTAIDAIPYAVGGSIAIPALIKHLKGRPKGSLTCELYNAERKLISTNTIKIDGQSKNSWQLIEETIRVPEDGYLLLRLSNEAKAPVWFDDLELVKTMMPKLSGRDKQVKLEKKQDSFHHITILSMTSNTDAGCGDDEEPDCCEEGLACCLPEVECSVCDMGTECYSECDCYPLNCEEEDPCVTDPSSCNNDDPCEDDYFSCECNPQNCEPNPCSIDPNTCECDPNYCQPHTDCAGVVNGTAYQNSCGYCVGGTTGRPYNYGCVPLPPDCAGVAGGSATINSCGQCVGGTTGRTNSWIYQDSDSDGWGNPDIKLFCFNLEGDQWVGNGLDHNDRCHNTANSSTQCMADSCGNQSINEMTSMLSNQTHLTTLRNSVLSGANYEIGYAMYENSNGAISFGNHQQGLPGVPGFNLSFPSMQGQTPAGFFHSHYTGTEYIFSADDLYNYFQWSFEHQNALADDMIGVVNPNGTAYSMVIEDSEALLDYLIKDWNPQDSVTDKTFATLEQFSDDYDVAELPAALMYPNNPEMAAELRFVQFLQTFGLTDALKLYEAGTFGENGYSNFRQLNRSANGTSAVPCQNQ